MNCFASWQILQNKVFEFQWVAGPGQVEEQTEEHLPGPHQEGGGEEDDGAADDRRDTQPCQEEKHQDLQGDRGGQVGGARRGLLL